MTNNTNMPPSLTIEELAERWSLTTRTLRNWRRDGRPMPQPCRWLGIKPARYLLSDIEEFEAKNR